MIYPLPKTYLLLCIKSQKLDALTDVDALGVKIPMARKKVLRVRIVFPRLHSEIGSVRH